MGADIADVHDPILRDFPLDRQIPRLGIRWMEVTLREEVETLQRGTGSVAGDRGEDGSASGAIKSNQGWHDLVVWQWKGRKRKQRWKRILRCHSKRSGAERLTEGQPSGRLQQGLVGNALVIDAVATAHDRFRIAGNIPGDADARGEVLVAEATIQRAIGNSGCAD